jgi:hypothetical protein
MPTKTTEVPTKVFSSPKQGTEWSEQFNRTALTFRDSLEVLSEHQLLPLADHRALEARRLSDRYSRRLGPMRNRAQFI